MTDLEDGFRSCSLPGYMLEGAQQYLVHHRAVGGFLMALFRNDLRNSVSLADAENAEALQRWVQFLYNYCPSDSHGSAGAVDRWIARGEKI